MHLFSWLIAGLLATLAALVYALVRWQQRRLRQAREMNARLRTVDRLKDEFLANTSHELRTPLHGIIGLAESILDRPDKTAEDLHSTLSMIISSGHRLSALVSNLLDLSLLQSGDIDLRIEPVDLAHVARMATHVAQDNLDQDSLNQDSLAQDSLEEKNLRFESTISEDLPAVLADEARLSQILHNLLQNAVKFTTTGSVEISARRRGRQIEVSVTDTGIGIEAEQQERIFEAFEQGEASTSRRFGGVGVGLAVTRQLVELQGGQISVESTPGVGSRFYFTLPAASKKLSSTDSILLPVRRTRREDFARAPVSTAAEDRDTAPKILIVDDEPINRLILSQQLGVAGYTVREAEDGPVALRLLAAESFDLVILDIMMPRMSGYEVCRSLRQRFSLADLPVIFLSAKNQIADLVEGFAAGGNDYVTKPASQEELLARVRAHLEARRPRP